MKTLNAILIIGFLATDFLLFHDVFKPGEAYTLVEYLIGALSVLTIVSAVHAIIRSTGK